MSARRQQAYRDRRKAAGMVEVNFFVPGRHSERFRQLAEMLREGGEWPENPTGPTLDTPALASQIAEAVWGKLARALRRHEPAAVRRETVLDVGLLFAVSTLTLLVGFVGGAIALAPPPH